MAAQPTHKCIVCGTKTDKACAGCRKAGIDICFCSPACQKLVWSRHKLVCGPGKASPFVWPRLTAEEAEDAINNRTMSLSVGSIEAVLGRVYDIKPADVPATIRSLAGPPPTDPEEIRYQSGLAGKVRFLEGLRMDIVAPVDVNAPEGPKDVILLQDIAVISFMAIREATFGYDEPAGRDRVLHLFLVYHAVLAKLFRASQRAESTPLLRNVIDQLEEALAEMPSEDTGAVPKLLRDLRSRLSPR
ncbi:hypothetical protein JCM10450v2_003513 [Rhodotorula kratochvilovae]